jgi:deoxyadenosine/deoxycytidine kinase
MSSKPILISIEGNIGSGKTTIIEQLQQHLANDPTILFLREPVEIWESICDSTGENILQKFYGNSSKYAFSFQVMAYATRLSMLRKLIRNNPECRMIICERSLDADKHIFAKMLYEDHTMEEIQYKIYQLFYTEYAEDFMLDGIVYIDATPETCHRRIAQRSREGESSISLEYLTRCHDYHQTWLNAASNIDVLKIDVNADVVYNKDDEQDIGMGWLEQIRSYYNKISGGK